MSQIKILFSGFFNINMEINKKNKFKKYNKVKVTVSMTRGKNKGIIEYREDYNRKLEVDGKKKSDSHHEMPDLRTNLIKISGSIYQKVGSKTTARNRKVEGEFWSNFLLSHASW